MRIPWFIFMALTIVTGPACGSGDEEAKAWFLKQAQEKAAAAKKVFATASYCTAYALKNDEDRRRVLDPKLVVNTETLRSRAAFEQRLAPRSAESVVEAALGRKGWHPIRECYEPHHVFVFYSAESRPVAAVEICLTCNRIRIMPGDVDTCDLYSSYETADMDAIAKLLHAVGLPLTPFRSLEEYLRR